MQTINENAFGKVMLAELGNGLEQLIIEHKAFNARVSLYGGQVLAWQPEGEEEVFWLSETSLFEQGKAIRGGIPLCWPWFGPYKDGGNHGFARQVNWQFELGEITEEHCQLTLMWEGENQHPLWPYKAKVEQKLVFGKTFYQALKVSNSSDKPFEFNGALHSYFNVSSPDNVTVPALNNVPFYCKLKDADNQQDSLTNIVGPLDRVYKTGAAMEIIDSGLARTIALDVEKVSNWVLWNPGKETAENMADIHAGGEDEYICLEAANTEWISVEAGAEYSFSQHIAIR
ncbi:MAG: D-hexose-6-phosphate mutarotase [Colwelliaceae bacterium]|nr:D-hexose-6-phosphate mutarotase [Colwelliaceae bacterium]